MDINMDDLTVQGTELAEKYASQYVAQGESSIVKAVETIKQTEYGTALGLSNISPEKIKKLTQLGLQAAGLYLIFNATKKHWLKIAVIGGLGFIALRAKMYYDKTKLDGIVNNTTL